MFTLLIMCVGTRFLTLVPLDELLLQSLFGKNIRRHQPFDYDRDLTLSTDDPRPVKEQAIQNVLAHWVPRFLVDAMLDLVVDNEGTTLNKGHTLTYKDPNSVISPLIASHLQKVYHMKPRVCDSNPLVKTRFHNLDITLNKKPQMVEKKLGILLLFQKNSEERIIKKNLNITSSWRCRHHILLSRKELISPANTQNKIWPENTHGESDNTYHIKCIFLFRFTKIYNLPLPHI